MDLNRRLPAGCIVPSYISLCSWSVGICTSSSAVDVVAKATEALSKNNSAVSVHLGAGEHNAFEKYGYNSLPYEDPARSDCILPKGVNFRS